MPAMHHDPTAARLALDEELAAHRREHRREQLQRASVFAIGRTLLAAVFIVSGVLKTIYFADVVKLLSDDGVPDARMLVLVGTIIELTGGAMIALGLAARTAAKGLIAYLAAVTVFLFIDSFSGFSRFLALTNFAFAGALLMVVAYGPGRFSLTHFFERTSRAHEL
jgi:putative oxidoreductase